MSRQLEWRETEPGLLYEAIGDAGIRFIVAADGHAWTLDLFIDDGEYSTEQAVDPQSTPLELARQMAQEWESQLT